MKNLSKYFSLRELTFSKIAEDNDIDNTPTPAILEKLKYTAQQLDKVRELLGCPVIINSGYRSLAVNRAIGSSDNSQHVRGEAVDFRTIEHTPRRIVELIKQSNIEFDQLILEFDSWVHISFSSRNRKQILIIDGKGSRIFV